MSALVVVVASSEPSVRCRSYKGMFVTLPTPSYAVTAAASFASPTPSIKTIIVSPGNAVTLAIDHVPPKMVPVFPLCKTPFTATATVPPATFVAWSYCCAVPDTVTPSDHVTVQSLSVGQSPALQTNEPITRIRLYVVYGIFSIETGPAVNPVSFPDNTASGTRDHESP